MSTWKNILAVIAIFVLGTIFGLVISHQISPVSPPPHERPARIIMLSQLEQMLEQELSAEQKQEISKILEEVRSGLEGLRKRARPEIGRKMKEAQDRIRDILTPEQREQFDQIIKRDRPMFNRPFRP